MAVMLGNYWGKEIADLLGLKDTRNIKITIPHDDFVLVEVEALLRDEDSKQITGWLQTKRYELREIAADEPVNLFDDGVADTTGHADANRVRVAE